MKKTGMVFLFLCAALQLCAMNATAKTVFGNDVYVKEYETVKDDMVLMGGSLTVRGVADGDAVTFGGSIVVDTGGQIKGDVLAFGGDIKVRDGGVIRKDAASIGGKVIIDPGGIIMGDYTSGPGFLPKNHIVPHLMNLPGAIGRGWMNLVVFGPFAGMFGTLGIVIGLVLFIFKMLISLAIAVIVTYLFPDSVNRMATILKDDFPRAALLGFLFTVLIPFTVLFMILTIVGILFVPFYIILVWLIYIFGSVGASLWIGRIIPESEDRSILVNVILGALVIGVVKNIPVIGFIVGMVIAFSAFGVVVMSWSRGRNQYAQS